MLDDAATFIKFVVMGDPAANVRPPPVTATLAPSDVNGIRPAELRNVVGAAAIAIFDGILVAMADEPRIPEIEEIVVVGVGVANIFVT